MTTCLSVYHVEELHEIQYCSRLSERYCYAGCSGWYIRHSVTIYYPSHVQVKYLFLWPLKDLTIPSTGIFVVNFTSPIF